jgi:hypothetical protein
MASQLRLRVVLPVVVLGVLGLGVGAFATRGPAPDAGQPPLPPTQGGTTTTKPQESGWAKRANAMCTRLSARKDALLVDEPKSAAEFEALVADLVEFEDLLARKFAELGWPRGEKKAVLALRSTLAKIVATSHDGLDALHAGNNAALTRAIEHSQPLVDKFNRGVKRLGAPVCADDPLGAISERAIQKYGSAEAALNHELSKHGVVVVLFYAPGDSYDTIQTRETRAGALAAGVGFLALDVTNNRQVGTLAAKHDVRDGPTTLIFKRGPKLVYRVAGYMDREAVAQAAADARS